MATLKPWDKVVIINSAARDDRWQQICQDIQKSALLTAAGVQRFEAVTPLTSVRPTWFADHWANKKNQNLGAYWGCKQSHMRVIEQAILEGVEHLLVLEDDADPAEDFDARFAEFATEMPGDWLGYKLGGNHWRAAERMPGKKVCGRLMGTGGTHCYGLNREGMQRVLDHMLWHRTEPNDACRSSLEREVPRFYGVLPWIIRQRPGFSDLEQRVLEKPTP